jgi:hypothetical protein
MLKWAKTATGALRRFAEKYFGLFSPRADYGENAGLKAICDAAHSRSHFDAAQSGGGAGAGGQLQNIDEQAKRKLIKELTETWEGYISGTYPRCPAPSFPKLYSPQFHNMSSKPHGIAQPGLEGDLFVDFRLAPDPRKLAVALARVGLVSPGVGAIRFGAKETKELEALGLIADSPDSEPLLNFHKIPGCFQFRRYDLAFFAESESDSHDMSLTCDVLLTIMW